MPVPLKLPGTFLSHHPASLPEMADTRDSWLLTSLLCKIIVPHIYVLLNKILVSLLVFQLYSNHIILYIVLNDLLSSINIMFVWSIWMFVLSFNAFLFTVKYYFMRLYINLLIYSLLVNYYLDCFQMGPTKNSAAKFSCTGFVVHMCKTICRVNTWH